MHKRTSPSGFTLVELLVALTIALVLTAVALPRVREGLQQNVATRSATMVKGVFENARANAIRTGRPYGVILHRVKNEVTPDDAIDDPLLFAAQGANYCKRLSFAQVAFDYRGDVEGATMRYIVPSTGLPYFEASSATAGLLYAVATLQIPVDHRPIDTGSIIRFGRQRAPVTITALLTDTSSNPHRVRVYFQPGFPVLPGVAPFKAEEDLTYTIETRPMASPLASISLPGKMVIDLNVSGFSYSPVSFSPSNIRSMLPGYPMLASGAPGFRDPIVMFSANGELDSVYLDRVVNYVPAPTYGYEKIRPVGPLSMLVGDIDGVVLPQTVARFPAPRPNTSPAVSNGFDHTGRKLPNFANPDAAWLSINPSSGNLSLKPVATPLGLDREAAAHPQLAGTHPAEVLIRERLLDSRRLTRGTIQ